MSATPVSPRAEGALPPVLVPRRSGQARILVSVALDGPSAVALQRADALAIALGAELHILHVVPEGRWTHAIRPPEDTTGEVAAAARRAAARESADHFCSLMLSHALTPDHLRIEEGAVVPAILRTASAIDADLMVVGDACPTRARVGQVVRALLRRTDRPFLIARTATRSHAIIAATDFSDEAFPALASASDLGERLHAPVTFVHNVTGIDEGVTRLRRDRLTELARGFGTGIDALVLARRSAVDAVLEVASQKDADLVVIGYHPEDTLAARGTAASVAVSSRRSVLAVPLARTSPPA